MKFIFDCSPARRFDKAAAWLLVGCGLALFFGCAQIVQPTGGPEDTTPPQLDTLRSTRNFQTYFKKQDIVLTFKEWVELKDVFNQVVVSPPLEYRPDVSRKKKSIVLHFDDQEVLRDSATYVINYGEAIRDITKGNVAPVVFVFSTGSYIDSLSVSGTVVDAFTANPVENVLFMLYENLADSVVRTERPFYFAKTDKTGKFKVDNVKSGTFKAFALLDKNLNYRYDGESEQIGFPDSLLELRPDAVAIDSTIHPTDSLSADSAAASPQRFPDSLRLDTTANPPAPPPTALEEVDSLPNKPPQTDTVGLDSVKTDTSLSRKKTKAPALKIRLFQEAKKLYLREKETNSYGRVNLGFSREPVDAILTYDSVGQTVVMEPEKDSIRVWYHTAEDVPWNIYVRRDTTIDTVFVKNGLRTSFLAAAKLAPSDKATAKLPLQHPLQPFNLTFNHPLKRYDPEKVRLLEDSIQTIVQPKIMVDTLQARTLLVGFAWKQGKAYSLQLLPGAATDLFGLSLADTLSQAFTVGQEKDYGTLTLQVEGLDTALAYIIRILGKNGNLFRQYLVDAVAGFQKTVPYMAPDTYTLELIEDLDKNGRWTTGSYDQHRQPERVQRKVLEELRANWEVEATLEARFE